MNLKLKMPTKNQFFSYLLSSIVWFKPLRTVLIYFGTNVYGVGRQWSIYSVIIFALILIIFLPFMKGIKITKDFIFLFLFLFGSWITSLIFHTEYISTWISEAVDIFVRAFPYYFVAKQIDDYSELKPLLYKTALFAVIIMGIMTLTGMSNDNLFTEDEKVYSQYDGLAISPAVTLCYLASLELNSIFYGIVAIAGTAQIIVFGARMPIACIMIAIVLYFILVKKPTEKGIKMVKKVIYTALVIVGIVWVIFTIIYLKGTRMKWIESGDRILWTIINGSFLKSEGRIKIWIFAINYVISHPIIGTGIIADRIPIWIAHLESKTITDSFKGSYAHNIFLELMMQYGIILGLVISLIIIRAVYYVLLKEKDKDKLIISIFAVAETFGVLMLSGPAFCWAPLWIMLGMCPNLFKFKVKRS